MKRNPTAAITVITLLAALALPAPLAAQHTRYKLIDIGTFGGPASYFTDPGIGGKSKVLNNRGMLAGKAETTTPIPSFGNVGNCPPACFVTHVFRWDKGVLTDLGALPGGDNSDIGGINARGWIVGCSTTGEIDPLLDAPLCHATLWKGNEIVDLGTLGGFISNAFHVDDGGQIVGASTTGTPDPLSFLAESIHPFVWQNGVMHDIGTLQDGTIALPSNQCGNGRNGLVTGFSFINSVVNPNTGVPTAHDFLWHDGKMEDIPTLGGTLVGSELDAGAECVNNRGQVAGGSTVSDDPLILHPYLWDHGVLTDLGTLGGSIGTVSWLNDAADVVGGASTPNDESFHATLWKKGVINDLGTLPGDCFSDASTINSNDQIVGASFNCDTNTLRAVLWNKGSIVDLNTLIPANSSLELFDATNINDRGEIAGRGLPAGCDDVHFCGHVFLLIPCGNATTCEDNTRVTTTATQNNAAIMTKRSSVSTQGPLMPMQRLVAWRAQLAQRLHLPRFGTPKH
ncbi:MAG: hypothetical protein AUH16_09540 [Acidobacteria bacterium 13_2_20CM_57_7]|nr:MAG: hypothetical protein AUH16_09540 [Acidobacteria bacterium 13_2_20CM_57_7]